MNQQLQHPTFAKNQVLALQLPNQCIVINRQHPWPGLQICQVLHISLETDAFYILQVSYLNLYNIVTIR